MDLKHKLPNLAKSEMSKKDVTNALHLCGT